MGKQLRCSLMGKWLNKIFYTYAMESYSGIKVDQILIDATTQMNSEGIVQGGIKKKNK